jgi:hypothetical protein
VYRNSWRGNLVRGGGRALPFPLSCFFQWAPCLKYKSHWAWTGLPYSGLAATSHCMRLYI